MISPLYRHAAHEKLAKTRLQRLRNSSLPGIKKGKKIALATRFAKPRLI